MTTSLCALCYSTTGCPKAGALEAGQSLCVWVVLLYKVPRMERRCGNSGTEFSSLLGKESGDGDTLRGILLAERSLKQSSKGDWKGR